MSTTTQKKSKEPTKKYTTQEILKAYITSDASDFYLKTKKKISDAHDEYMRSIKKNEVRKAIEFTLKYLNMEKVEN